MVSGLGVFSFQPWLCLPEGQLRAYAQLLFRTSGSEGAIKLWSETDHTSTLAAVGFGTQLDAREKVIFQAP